MRCFFALVLFLGLSSNIFAQKKTARDSISTQTTYRFEYKALIFPSVLFGYGVVGLESCSLKRLNNSIQNKFFNQRKTLKIDDVSQYTPSLSVYALNAFGVEGKHNFKDRTLILGTAFLIMGTTVSSIKKISNVTRPDSSANNSFPSGHTATAFVGAEFLYQEYKDISIWYGVSGYLVAASTGFFRMYNNRHWLTDVSAGAGIGILSTKIAYWTHPLVKNAFRKKERKISGLIMPFYIPQGYGIGLNIWY